MQPNPNFNNQATLHDATHSKSYDPSEQYRAMLMPPPQPVVTTIPPNNQYTLNPVTSQNGLSIMDGPRNGGIKRIPQYYYPRYEGDNPPITDPYVPPPPPMMEQPVPLSTDPYTAGQYYPYATPYIIPLAPNYLQPDPSLLTQDRSKSDVIASHQKDADLSRLEVYHFTPKNASLPFGGSSQQPIIQYHVYPYPPAAPPAAPPQQQYPPYPNPWYGQPTYPPPPPAHVPVPSEPILPPIETKARSAQTEEPSMKSRGVSPFYFSAPAPVYDDDGYPYVHHRTMHTDRYNLPTGRINRRFYDHTESPLLDDCRCLNCQRERSKVLNYYPD